MLEGRWTTVNEPGSGRGHCCPKTVREALSSTDSPRSWSNSVRAADTGHAHTIGFPTVSPDGIPDGVHFVDRLVRYARPSGVRRARAAGGTGSGPDEVGAELDEWSEPPGSWVWNPHRSAGAR